MGQIPDGFGYWTFGRQPEDRRPPGLYDATREPSTFLVTVREGFIVYALDPRPPARPEHRAGYIWDAGVGAHA